MKRNIIIFTLCTIFFSAADSAERLCTDSTAEKVAQIYALLAPHIERENLPKLINDRTLTIGLSRDGQLIKCMKSAGSKFVHKGISDYDKHAYEKAINKAREIGAPELASGVASSINQISVSTFILGTELLWLSDVLPKVIDGNSATFFQTGTNSRNQIRQALASARMIESMMGGGYGEIFSTIMRQQFTPVVANELYFLLISSDL